MCDIEGLTTRFLRNIIICVYKYRKKAGFILCLMLNGLCQVFFEK